ncbi:MAG: hypothetical protein RJA36_3837 [Pseudomonadota bacterium]|jgi:hypothetical protein
MSNTKCFDYQVGSEVVSNCLGILERAAQRVARGHSAVVGGSSSACKNGQVMRYEKAGRRGGRRTLDPELVESVVQLRGRTMTHGEIARKLCIPRSQVAYILGREGISPMRRAA